MCFCVVFIKDIVWKVASDGWGGIFSDMSQHWCPCALCVTSPNPPPPAPLLDNEMRVLLLVDGLWELWSGTFCLLVCSRVSLLSSPEQCKLLYCTHVRSLLSGILLISYELFQHVVLSTDTRMLMCYKDNAFDAFTLHMAFSTPKQRGCWLWTAAWRHSMPCYVRAQKAWAITGRLRNAEKQSLREFGRKRDEHTGLFLCNIVVKTG